MSIKPSHLFDPVEQMATAEVLSTIVERACLYIPEKSVGVSSAKEALTRVEKGFEGGAFRSRNVPKEELSEVLKVSEGGTFQSKNVPKEKLFEAINVPVVASSAIVRSK